MTPREIRLAPSIYYKEGRGRKRKKPDGTFEKCFLIRLNTKNGRYCETVGWESEGITLEKAQEVLQLRLNGIPKSEEEKAKKKVKKVSAPAIRVKTEYPGIYCRYSYRRKLPDGQADKCFEIMVTLNNRLTYEKVGWLSEGYTIEDAVKIRSFKIKEARHPELFGKTFDELWMVYKERHLPNLKRENDIVYMYNAHIQPVFGTRFVSSVTPLEMEKFKQELLTRCSLGTVKNIFSTLGSILNKAKEWRILEPSIENPAKDLRFYGSDKKRERYLTEEEAQAILLELSLISCELYFAAKISLYTGMRLNEILQMKVAHVDIHAQTIFIPNGKTGDRYAYFPRSLTAELQSSIANKPKDRLIIGRDYKKTYISTKFSTILALMKINQGVTDSRYKVVFHTFRHTFCSWLAIKGVPLYTIAQLAGHKDISMTQRYAKLSPDAKRAALDLLVK